MASMLLLAPCIGKHRRRDGLWNRESEAPPPPLTLPLVVHILHQYFIHSSIIIIIIIILCARVRRTHTVARIWPAPSSQPVCIIIPTLHYIYYRLIEALAHARSIASTHARAHAHAHTHGHARPACRAMRIIHL